MAEYREPEGRLGDENVAGDDLEGRASRVAGALVVARDDDARALRLDDDLRRTEHVAGGNEGDADTVDLLALAGHRGLGAPAKPSPQRTAMISSVSRVAMTARWPGRA